MSRLIPFAHAINVYDIDIAFFVSLKVKYIFLDLDNTLDTHICKDPSARAIKLIKDLKEAGLVPYIISNNKEKRVKRYADQCGAKYTFKSKKPFGFKIRKFMKKENIKPEEVIMIGDQLMTDVRCAKNIGVRCILTEKLWPGDQFITKFLRWLDTIKRTRLRKDNLLKDWRIVYGSTK